MEIVHVARNRQDAGSERDVVAARGLRPYRKESARAVADRTIHRGESGEGGHHDPVGAFAAAGKK